MSFLYNKAALLGGATIGAGEIDTGFPNGYPDRYGDLIGGFAPYGGATSDEALVESGQSLYNNVGLTNRQKVSLQYAVQRGKATPAAVYGMLGLIYAIDSLRWRLKFDRTLTAADRMALLQQISELRGRAGSSKEMKALYAKISKMLHPKPRARRNVTAYLKDADAPYRRGAWNKNLPVGIWLKDPAARERRAALWERLRAQDALGNWKAYYGTKGRHRRAAPTLDGLGFLPGYGTASTPAATAPPPPPTITPQQVVRDVEMPGDTAENPIEL